MSPHRRAVAVRPFGTLPDGRAVEVHDLVGERISVSVCTYGARIVSLRAPDRSGALDEVLLGFDDLAGYLTDRDYHGATVGRFANRIAAGRFELDGEVHQVPPNEGANALHGGGGGFHACLWTAEALPPGSPGSPGSPGAEGAEAAVRMTLRSPDGDMGFPGALDVAVVFAVSGGDLIVDYEARTDRPTVVNLTQHGYLNLAPGRTGDDHLLQVDASTYLPVGTDKLPLGPAEPVAGTPFDLRSPVLVGDAVRTDHPQVRIGAGIDHAFLLDGPLVDGLRRAAWLEHAGTGRAVEVWTDQPSLQVYTGSMLTGEVAGRGGRMLRSGDGICLEPQHLPDSPNHPEYPPTVLRPGGAYRAREVLRTSVAGVATGRSPVASTPRVDSRSTTR